MPLDPTKKGNGAYVKKLKNNDDTWLTGVAKNQVECMQRCYSTQMKQKMWDNIIRPKWIQAGEEQLANSFSDVYLGGSPFRDWNFNTSGLPMCYPCNQPLELANLQMKGTKSMVGIMKIGVKFENALYTELPKFVEYHSTWSIMPTINYPVLNIDHCFNSDTFMQGYNKYYDPTIDRRDMGGTILANDILKLSQPISDQRVQNCIDAYYGVYSGNDEEEMLSYCTGLHILQTKTVQVHGVQQTMWTCNCFDYFTQGRCYPSLQHQHHNRLLMDGDRIDTKKRHGRKTERQKEKELLKVAMSERKTYLKSLKSKK